LSSGSTALVSVTYTSLYHTITTRGQQLQEPSFKEEIFIIITWQIDN